MNESNRTIAWSLCIMVACMVALIVLSNYTSVPASTSLASGSNSAERVITAEWIGQRQFSGSSLALKAGISQSIVNEYVFALNGIQIQSSYTRLSFTNDSSFYYFSLDVQGNITTYINSGLVIHSFEYSFTVPVQDVNLTELMEVFN